MPSMATTSASNRTANRNAVTVTRDISRKVGTAPKSGK